MLLEEDGARPGGPDDCRDSAGRVVKEQFPVNFPLAGEHLITARLDGDAVAADNFRYAAVDLPAEVPVLLVDGDARRPTPATWSVALSPGGQVHGHPAADRDAALSGRQAVGAISVHQPGQRRAAGPIGGRRPWSSTSATAAAWPSSSASSPTAGLSTRCSIATARGCSPCRWPGRPSWRSIAWRRRPTWRWTPDTSSSACSPTSATATWTRCWWSGTSPPAGLAAADRLDHSRAGPARNGAPLVVERGFGKGRVVAFLDHGGADVEQLGPKSQLRRRHAGLGSLFEWAAHDEDRGKSASHWK